MRVRLIAGNVYFWLLRKAEKHESLARYYRTSAHTWRTIWDGRQQLKSQEKSEALGSAQAANTKRTGPTSGYNENSSDGNAT